MAGHRYRDPQEGPQRPCSESGRGETEVLRHRLEAGARLLDEERRSHEHLRHDDRGGGERYAQPVLSQPRPDALLPEEQQQREARRGRRQHQRQVDQGVDDVLAPELLMGQPVGNRGADGNHDDQ